MKLAILFCLFFSSVNAYAPWMEDPHFAEYKCLMVQSKLMQIEEIVKEIRNEENENEVNAILFHIKNIRQLFSGK